MARPAVKALAAAMTQMAADEAAAAAALIAAEDAQHEPFVTQSAEAKELYIESSIPRIAPPTALEFYRDFVARNKPVIITDALQHWPAMQRWTLKGYLRSKLAGTDVTIDRVPVDDRSRLTTDGVGEGLGDSVVRGSYFVTPSEERMRFGEFMDCVEGKRATDGVLYCQHQNNSLVDEFTSVHADVSELPFASEAFGSVPDATNLWIGTDRSVSTLHHDPYENIYAVIAGSKQFLLYPPTDFHWLDKREYPKCRWHYEPPTAADAADASAATTAASSAASDSTAAATEPASPSTPSTVPKGKFTLIPDPDGTRTAWFDLEPQGAQGCLDPEHGSASSGLAFDYTALPPLELSKESTVQSLPAPGPFPPYVTHPRMSDALRRRHASPIWVELQAGEVLYLPSLWFHRVAQRGAGADSEDAATAASASSAAASSPAPAASSASSGFSKLTIAVNFWYDMSFDSRYTAFKFQEAVSKERREANSQRARRIREQEGQEKSMVRPKVDAVAAVAAIAATPVPAATSAASSAKSPAANSASSSSKPASAASVKAASPKAATSAAASTGFSVPSQPAAPLAPPILLLTLCGLPAAGKSSLCRALSMHAADALEQQGLPASCQTHYISFDAVYERLLKRSQRNAADAGNASPPAFSPALWKQSRLVALQWAGSIIAAARAYAASSTSATAGAPHLLLLDDNFYLRSMRRRVFQLARRYSTGFMQLYVVCDVEEAVRRNAARNQESQQQEQQPLVSSEDEQLLLRILNAMPPVSLVAVSSSADSAEDGAEFDAASLLAVNESSQVSEATIRKMAAAFQPPPVAASSAASSSAAATTSSAASGWERDSVRFEPGELRSLMETLTRMAAAFRAPWNPVADAAAEAERLSAARAQSDSSYWHQLDLATRKIVGQRIAEKTVAGADSGAVQEAAKRWNAQRKQFLSEQKQAGVTNASADSDAALASIVAQFESQLTN